MGDLLRLGVAAQCRSAVGKDLLVFIGDTLGDSGVNRARANTVDGDTFMGLTTAIALVKPMEACLATT